MSANGAPAVTVVIPCYNAEKSIREAIESVFAQTYENWVIVVVDDGSTDSSPHILGELRSGRENRIRVISGSNRGACHARNRGIDEASTEYIAFLDADDLWSPRKLELQVSYLDENPDAVGVTTAYTMATADGSLSSHTLYFDWTKKMLVDWALLGSSAPALNSTLMVRSDVIDDVGRYDEKLVSFAEDLDLAWRLASGGRLGCLPFPLAVIGVGPGQGHRDLESMGSALRIFYAKLSLSEPRLAAQCLVNMNIHFGFRLLAHGQFKLAIPTLIWSFLLTPIPLLRWMFRRVSLRKRLLANDPDML